MPTIRPFQNDDWPGLWQFLEPVFRAGDSYPYPTDISSDEAYARWVTTPLSTWVAEDEDGTLLGSYHLKANQPDLGAHVANCGYAVARAARGRGVASALCRHSQEEALRQGFRAMQYNLVVATNTTAVDLWQRMGFTIVGRLPGAFRHAELGYVDAFIMYKSLIGDT